MDAGATFEEIPSRPSCDISFMRMGQMEGQPENMMPQARASGGTLR